MMLARLPRLCRAAVAAAGSALLLSVLTPLAVQAQPAPGIDHVEPPSWWVGMRSPELQLMLHGPELGRFTPRLASALPGVTLTRVQTVASPNYLFVTLRIAPQAKPGEIALDLKRGNETRRLRYTLAARQPGSAQRQGFGPQDVILNLVPDRFANGDPGNDTVPGYPDKLDRSDDSAGRHGGDLAGMTQHLDYIQRLGFTQIWPTPLMENKQPAYSYHGYAITDSYRVDPRFGSNEDYRRFVAAARARGIGVIQDVVLNHIGSGHWWMQDLPTPDWLGYNGGHVPTRHFRTAVPDTYAAQDDRLNFTSGWFDDHMPDMNQRQPLLATYQIQNAIWWVEWAGLSGLRIDTYGYNDRDFLARGSARLMAEYPRLNIVGEEWSANPVVISQWLRGVRNPDGYVSHLPSVMDFPLNETLRRALVEPDSYFKGLPELYAALVNDRLYPDPKNLVLFEGNHDMPRLFSALGDDVALTKMALVYVLTMPRIPQLYYGTEVLMPSTRERDDGAARRDFPGGWAGDAVNAFTGQGLTPAQRDMQAFVQRLLTWRKTQTVIHQGRLTHYTPENGSYVWFRHDGRRQVMVVINKNQDEVTLDTRRFHERLAPDAQGVDILSGEALDLRSRLGMPPRSVRVIELRP